MKVSAARAQWGYGQIECKKLQIKVGQITITVGHPDYNYSQTHTITVGHPDYNYSGTHGLQLQWDTDYNYSETRITTTMRHGLQLQWDSRITITVRHGLQLQWDTRITITAVGHQDYN